MGVLVVCIRADPLADLDIMVAVRIAHEYAHAFLAQQGLGLNGVREEDHLFQGFIQQIIRELRVERSGDRP